MTQGHIKTPTPTPTPTPNVKGANTFKVGQVYHYTDWFTGGDLTYRVLQLSNSRACACSSRNSSKRKVTFAVTDAEVDGTSHYTEQYEIRKDDKGNEFIKIFTWGQYGITCCICAEHAEPTNGATYGLDDFDDDEED